MNSLRDVLNRGISVPLMQQLYSEIAMAVWVIWFLHQTLYNSHKTMRKHKM